MISLVFRAFLLLISVMFLRGISYENTGKSTQAAILAPFSALSEKSEPASEDGGLDVLVVMSPKGRAYSRHHLAKQVRMVLRKA